MCSEVSRAAAPCSAAVKKALGVDADAEWQECNMVINSMFYGEWM